jgi:hypothetical protein
MRLADNETQVSKLKMVVVVLRPFFLFTQPLLFCGPSMPNLPYTGRKGWWKLTKLNRASFLAYELTTTKQL